MLRATIIFFLMFSLNLEVSAQDAERCYIIVKRANTGQILKQKECASKASQARKQALSNGEMFIDIREIPRTEIKSPSVASKRQKQHGTPVLDGLLLGGAALFADGLANPRQNTSSGGYSSPGTDSENTEENTILYQQSNLPRDKAMAGRYEFFEHYEYRQGQKVVARGKCGDGTRFTIRYSPNTGFAYRYTIYADSGASKDEVARKFCRNH